MRKYGWLMIKTERELVVILMDTQLIGWSECWLRIEIKSYEQEEVFVGGHTRNQQLSGTRKFIFFIRTTSTEYQRCPPVAAYIEEKESGSDGTASDHQRNSWCL